MSIFQHYALSSYAPTCALLTSAQAEGAVSFLGRGPSRGPLRRPGAERLPGDKPTIT